MPTCMTLVVKQSFVIVYKPLPDSISIHFLNSLCCIHFVKREMQILLLCYPSIKDMPLHRIK